MDVKKLFYIFLSLFFFLSLILISALHGDVVRLKDGRTLEGKIVEEAKEITLEDLIVEEDMVVTISNAGYIKRVPLTLYHRAAGFGRG